MKHLFLCTLLAIAISAAAQDKPFKVDPGYRYVYKETTLETDDYKIYVEDGLSVESKAKFRVRVFNKTNDYLMIKPSDITFVIDGKNFTSTDKPFFVVPNDEATKVIDAKGNGMQVNKYTVEIKNVYKLAANSPSLKTNDFEIPLSAKSFTAGNFKCDVKSAAIKTEKTLLKFECIYTGDAIGILAPTTAAAIMPRGQENPNANRNKGMLLEKGKSDNFLLDFKEVKNGGDMQREKFKIKWNDTFKESKPEPIAGGKFDMDMDPVKTSEKNK